MSILAVGLNHRSAPWRLLERLSAGAEDTGKILTDLLGGEHVAEAVLLSTCNRVEVYASVTTFHGGVGEVTDLLGRVSGVPLAELSEALYVHHEARAVAHLLGVACGLDSMLIGEAQILGQVRHAFRVAQEEGAIGRTTGELFRHALRVGKRARTETGIDRAGASLVGAGARLAEQHLGGLAGRPVLLVGAGSTGGLAAATFGRAGAGPLVVANRSPERGARLAASVRGRSCGLDELATEVAAADIVVTSTASTGQVLEFATVQEAVAARSGRPLFLLDLALPHDIDPAVRALPGVTLADLDVLRAAVDTEGGGDVEAVRTLVAEEVGNFLSWQRAARVAPTVVALRAKADALVASELTRLSWRLPDLDPRTADEIASTVRRVVDKLLHAPTVRVKELAESPGGDAYAEALRELFGLDRKTLEVVSLPETAL